MKRKAIFLLYRALQTAVFPALLVYLLVRGMRSPQYFGTLRERFGELPALWQKTAPGAIWLHAVSVGEVLAALPLIDELLRRHPAAPVFLSTSTLAGRETAEKRLRGVVDGIFYAPLDFVWVVRRILRWLRPSLLIVLETEIWPNLYREAKRVGCGLMVVNGRISDRAIARYRRFAPLFSEVLPLCDRILAQSDEMRARYMEAGAPAGIAEVAGNLKYDFQPASLPPDSPVHRFLGAFQSKPNPLWIAASTSADSSIEEEDFVISAQARLPGWRLILAPRQPQRFDAVARKLEKSGLSWTRRTALGDPAADVLLLDSIGELSALFAHADVVFMGGTLAAKGGHNILEPAIFGKPVVAGPHLENFRDIERHFEAQRAVLRIASGDEIAAGVLRAAADPDLGARALKAAELQRGAASRTADVAMALYNSSYPSDRPAQPVWMFLWFFAQLWRAGSAIDRRLKRHRSRSLPVPVVSVGNITTGGTGKTPVTIELLAGFQSIRPALLTRGHGRSTGDTVLLPRGNERLPVGLTGDEVQLYVRGAGVPIGIGVDRYDVGTSLLREAAIGAFFLDDGFQHLQLRRNFDLVLIDSLNPFGGGHLLPLGRLREPLEGLARAHAFLLTRENETANVAGIEATLRRYNPHAPIFHSRTVARRWTNPEGETLPINGIAGLRSIAFCGLGNPRSFWKSLDQLGAQTVERFDYGDHHRYTPVEIRRLAQHARDLGVEALLTTAKDSVNLCPEFGSMIRPLRLYWLEIGIEIDGRDDLLALISQNI